MNLNSRMIKSKNCENIVRLDKNESPYELPDFLKKKCLKEFLCLRWARYPEGEEETLKILSNYAEFPPEGILLGNGSNELIQSIFLAFLEKGKKVLLPDPCFSIYPWMASVAKSEVIYTGMDSNFRYDYGDLIKKAKSSEISLIVLLSPHNPCGCIISENVIEEIISSVSVPVLIDEAYYEFSGKTFKNLIEEHHNIIILRTFSKAFSIAGLRIGYMLGKPEIVNKVANFKPPFSINSFSLVVVKKLLKYKNIFRQISENIVKNREKLFESLKKIKGIKPFPSMGNFILFELEDKDSAILFDKLEKRGVVVRKFFNDKRLKKCLRVSVGGEEENEKFIRALKEAINEI